MKYEQKLHTITDPSALDELRSCKTIKELVARLKQMDIECTHEEALRFLRTWEKLDDEREALDFEEYDQVAGGSGGFGGFFKSLFSPGKQAIPEPRREPMTIADVLARMK